MKNQVMEYWVQREGQLIACFGEARLVQVDDHLELRGGSMADRLEALEWVSLFMPDEVTRIRRD